MKKPARLSERLGPATLLRLALPVQVDVETDGSAAIRKASKRFLCGVDGLGILNAFARPRTLKDALDELGPRAAGAADWIALTSEIARLYEAGILCDGKAPNPDRGGPDGGYGDPAVHVAMLDDRARTEAFLRAIRATVRPDDVVVDIGTGTGVLAVAAAKAGARRVYAIEATKIAGAAERLARDNGVADRVTVIRGWSTRVALPERGTALVTEMIGNEPLGEDLLSITLDAKRRLLVEQARLIPSALSIWALPVALPESELHRLTFTRERAEEWTRRYDMDFRGLPRLARPAPQRIYVKPQAGKLWTALAPPLRMADLDLAAAESLTVEACARARAVAAGRLTGVMIYFDAALGDAVLSTAPWAAGRSNHWRNVVWVFPEGPELAPGEPFSVSYRYDGEREHLRVSPSSGRGSPRGGRRPEPGGRRQRPAAGRRR